MPEHHHQPRAEARGGEFDAADLRRRHDVARNPDHEQIAQALVEHDLGRHPRVRAAEHDRERGLILRQVRAPRRQRHFAICALGDEAAVAFV